MRKSRVLSKLRNNDPVLVTVCHFTDPTSTELTSLMGFDGIWIDLEHHAFSVETADQMFRAARVGVSDIMARPAKGEFMRMGRLLESGATGILYPRCDNADEAREVVRWSKFAPLGTRGFDGANPDNPFCAIPMPEYIRQANEETFIAIQIEDPAALENVDEIAAVEGVDILFLGPGDFSIISGIPGQFDHDIIEDATQRVAAAARKAGKHWGMPCFNIEHGRKLLDMGARFLGHGADIMHLKLAQIRMQQEFGELGFTFEPQIPV